MKANVDEIDFDAARAYEKKLRHDVMAHVHTFGDAVPSARGIIHLGATSCYVTDNTRLDPDPRGFASGAERAGGAIDAMASFADRWKSLACLGYTHFQPAQLVTVGKRATLWCHELILDLIEVEHRIQELKFLGVKGTTGTQASFLALFDGDHTRVEALDRKVAEAFGFAESYAFRGRRTHARLIRRSSEHFRSGRDGSSVRLRLALLLTSARWKNRSRPTRSARRRWPTSETRCVRSGSARWRALR